MQFKDLLIDNNININNIDFNGNNIEVKTYLPIKDKYDLINITLQNSIEGSIYNTLKVNMYFELYVVYMYSNLEFSDEEKQDPTMLYDKLAYNGLIKAIIEAIPEEEFNYLDGLLHDVKWEKTKYRNTISYTINNLIEGLPINASQALEIINKFNPEDFQQVMNFVKAINNGKNPQ